MRCFVAIPTNDNVRSRLERILRQLPRSPADLKPATASQLHITLKFLGELPDPDVPRACEIVRRACAGMAPFGIEIAGIGCFPDQRAPRVLWAGVSDPAGICHDWVRRADPDFADLGIDPERRAFSPHITLARTRSSRGADLIRDWRPHAREPAPTPMYVDRIVLYESRLDRTGAGYTPLATIKLPAAD